MEKLLVVFAFGSFFLLPMAMGIFALREINRSAGPMKGRWLAIAAIVIGMAGIAISVPMTLVGFPGKPIGITASVSTGSNGVQDAVRSHNLLLGEAEGSVLRSNASLAQASVEEARALRYRNTFPAEVNRLLETEEKNLENKIKQILPSATQNTSKSEQQLADALYAAEQAMQRSDLDAAQKYVDVGKSLKPGSTELKKLADLIAERRKKLELARVTQEAEIHARRMLDEARKRDLEERAKAENVERTQPVSPPQPVAAPTPPKVAPTSTKASSVGEQDPFSE